MDKDTDLTALKKELKSVVVSNPSSMNINDLNKDYKEIVGQSIPFRDYGHRDLNTFLRKECADVFQFQGDSTCPIVIPIISNEIKHLNNLITRQKTNNKKPSKRPKNTAGKRFPYQSTVKTKRPPVSNFRITVNNNQTKINVQEKTQTSSRKVYSDKNKINLVVATTYEYPKDAKQTSYESLSSAEDYPERKLKPWLSGSSIHDDRYTYDDYEDNFSYGSRMSSPNFSHDNNYMQEPIGNIWITSNSVLTTNDYIPEIDHVEVNSTIKIVMTDVKNPNRFYFNLLQYDEDLKHLVHDINDFYVVNHGYNFSIPMHMVEPDMYCAVFYHGSYARGLIMDISGYRSISVCLIDKGILRDVHMDDIKFLPKVFSHLPAQAMKGQQVGISPLNKHFWSMPSVCKFSNLVDQKILKAKVVAHSPKNVFYLDLMGGTEFIRKLMISNGYARST